MSNFIQYIGCDIAKYCVASIRYNVENFFLTMWKMWKTLRQILWKKRKKQVYF